jgi:hypothetical protein
VIGQDEVEVVETGMSACPPYPGEFARAHDGVGDVTEGGTVIDTDPEDDRGVGAASSDFDGHS